MKKEIQNKKKKEMPDKAIFIKKYKPEEAVKLAKEHNGGKKFNQTIDVCIAVKQMDFKKQENKIKETIHLDNNAGLKKIVFVIGKNLSISANNTADEVFNEKQYSDLEKDKKKVKRGEGAEKGGGFYSYLAGYSISFLIQSNMYRRLLSSFYPSFWIQKRIP